MNVIQIIASIKTVIDLAIKLQPIADRVLPKITAAMEDGELSVSEIWGIVATIIEKEVNPK